MFLNRFGMFVRELQASISLLRHRPMDLQPIPQVFRFCGINESHGEYLEHA